MNPNEEDRPPTPKSSPPKPQSSPPKPQSSPPKPPSSPPKPQSSPPPPPAKPVSTSPNVDQDVGLVHPERWSQTKVLTVSFIGASVVVLFIILGLMFVPLGSPSPETTTATATTAVTAEPDTPKPVETPPEKTSTEVPEDLNDRVELPVDFTPDPQVVTLSFEDLASNIVSGTSWMAKSRTLEHQGYRFTNLDNPNEPDPGRIPYSIAISRIDPVGESLPEVALNIHYKSRKMEISRIDGKSFHFSGLTLLWTLPDRPGSFTIIGTREGREVEQVGLPFTEMEKPVHKFSFDWQPVDTVILDTDQSIRRGLPKIIQIQVTPASEPSEARHD